MSDIQVLSRGFVATCVVSIYSGKHCVHVQTVFVFRITLTIQLDL